MTQVEAVVDTGFTGHLALPPALIGELSLPLRAPATRFLPTAREAHLMPIGLASNGTSGYA